jgi:hypothetical protein
VYWQLESLNKEEVIDLTTAMGVELITQALNQQSTQFEQALIQDLSHISTAAIYAGNLVVDAVVHLKGDLYRCEYSYDWQIGWTCSGTQEAGRVREKVRFTLNETGRLSFKFLKLD